MPAPELRTNSEHLKTLDINNMCRCLGYWPTGNIGMSATRDVVRENARVARDPFKNRTLTRIFCRTLCIERNWLPVLGSPHRMVAQTLYVVYTFTTADGGHECLLPSGALTQALQQHVDQCMRREDVVKMNMLAQLARTLEKWHCNLFTDLIDEMELWARVTELRRLK